MLPGSDGRHDLWPSFGIHLYLLDTFCERGGEIVLRVSDSIQSIDQSHLAYVLTEAIGGLRENTLGACLVV